MESSVKALRAQENKLIRLLTPALYTDVGILLFFVTHHLVIVMKMFLPCLIQGV